MAAHFEKSTMLAFILDEKNDQAFLATYLEAQANYICVPAAGDQIATVEPWLKVFFSEKQNSKCCVFFNRQWNSCRNSATTCSKLHKCVLCGSMTHSAYEVGVKSSQYKCPWQKKFWAALELLGLSVSDMESMVALLRQQKASPKKSSRSPSLFSPKPTKLNVNSSSRSVVSSISFANAVNGASSGRSGEPSSVSSSDFSSDFSLWSQSPSRSSQSSSSSASISPLMGPIEWRRSSIFVKEAEGPPSYELAEEKEEGPPPYVAVEWAVEEKEEGPPSYEDATAENFTDARKEACRGDVKTALIYALGMSGMKPAELKALIKKFELEGITWEILLWLKSCHFSEMGMEMGHSLRLVKFLAYFKVE